MGKVVVAAVADSLMTSFHSKSSVIQKWSDLAYIVVSSLSSAGHELL